MLDRIAQAMFADALVRPVRISNITQLVADRGRTFKFEDFMMRYKISLSTGNAIERLLSRSSFAMKMQTVRNALAS